MSQIDELEARLDTLARLILPPLRASKHLSAQALDDLNQLVADLIREIGDSPVVPRVIDTAPPRRDTVVPLHPDAHRS
jgi:hypothetical protein